jgi:hypothetical protein
VTASASSRTMKAIRRFMLVTESSKTPLSLHGYARAQLRQESKEPTARSKQPLCGEAD